MLVRTARGPAARHGRAFAAKGDSVERSRDMTPGDDGDRRPAPGDDAHSDANTAGGVSQIASLDNLVSPTSLGAADFLLV